MQTTTMWVSGSYITGHGCALSSAARDAIYRPSSWAFRAISFAYHSILPNGAAECSEEGGCGKRGVPIVLPRGPPETGITLPAGPAKTPVGRDGRMMQACDRRPHQLLTASCCTSLASDSCDSSLARVNSAIIVLSTTRLPPSITIGQQAPPRLHLGTHPTPRLCSP